MAVPPTSPLRTLPQPVAVDVQGFMPQADLFQQTMGAYEKGMKLPLLQEQIKTEKMRNKLERDKLKLAEQTLLEDDARARAAADLDAKMKAAEFDMLKTQLAAAQQALKQNEENISVSSVFSGGGVGYNGTSGDTQQTPTADKGTSGDTQSTPPSDDSLPLTYETVEETNISSPALRGLANNSPFVSQQEKQKPSGPPMFDRTYGDRMISSPSAEAPKKDAAAAAAAPFRKIMSTLVEGTNIDPATMKLLPTVESVQGGLEPFVTVVPDVNAYIQNTAEQRAAASVLRPNQTAMSASQVKTFKELRDKYIAESKPVSTKVSFVDYKTGIPFTVNAIKVGDSVVNPDYNTLQIDTKTLYENNESRKTVDNEFAKTFAESIKADGGIGGSNKLHLDWAAKALTDAIKNNDGTISGAMVGILPQGLRALLPGLKEGVAVQEAILQVVQQSLKATLGGQFAQKEAEYLFNRAFNPKLGADENLRRLNALRTQIESASQIMGAAGKYYNANGTLAGFNLTPDKRQEIIDTIYENFEREIDSSEVSNASSLLNSPEVSAVMPKMVQTDRVAGF